MKINTSSLGFNRIMHLTKVLLKIVSILIAIVSISSCRFSSMPDNQKLIVCITFDDNYPSALENAVPIMQQYGYRGTMFINSGNVGNPIYMSWAQLSELKNQHGWEIGGHALHHDNLAFLDYEQAEQVIKSDYDSLLAHGFNPISFATPFGICPDEYYPIVMKYYRNLRTCIDVQMYSPVNRTYIGCFGVSRDMSPQVVESRIRQAVLEKENLVVLLFHRIAPGLPNISNYEPAKFAEVMRRLNNMDITVLPMDEALNYLEE
jgi:peptidoglycan/xylan/chitin deacetylase (PgdA/CDA1 family)